MSQSMTFQEGTLSYSDTGGRRNSFLLLHGFCEDRSIWKDLTPYLVDKGFRVISLDLPGFGNSSALTKSSIKAYADASLALLKALRLEQVIIAGHSMGGYVGLNMLRRFPGRIRGLSLVHSHPWADSDEKKANRKKSIDFIHKHGHALYVKQLIPTLFEPDFARRRTFVVDVLVHRAARFPSAGIIGALEAMTLRRDESDALSKSECPVQFILGKQDGIIPWEEQIRQTQLPDVADVRILEKSGHMGLFEEPQTVQKAIAAFGKYCWEGSPAEQ